MHHCECAGGTASAVLVDAAGRLASPVAVGAQAVMALATPVETELSAMSEPAGVKS